MRPPVRLRLPPALARGVLLLLLCAQAAAAQTTLLLSYEAMPAAQVDLPRAKDAPYAEKEMLARAVAEELVPGVIDAMGLDPLAAKTEIAPGGYEGKTNPSLQTALPAAEARARRLAAALGYVLRQQSVLVSDLSDAGGGSLCATVGFREPPSPAAAHAFFLHAARTDKGLGGGYSAAGGRMLFINLRGADGKPFGGLDDAGFAAALKRAAATFPGAAFAGEAGCRAYLVENDWAKAANGEDYAAAIGPDASALLLARLKHTVMVEIFAARLGWR